MHFLPFFKKGEKSMAFDGIVISDIVSELRHTILGGRIYKIYQPEQDELNIVIKSQKENYRLLLSADASLPLVYLMSHAKENPMAAPNFCMLLRKYIGNGRLIDIRQPGFERIVEFTIEHLDEMGDLCRKKLIIEIMGKHSNIIFTDDAGMIIDSIKHISHFVSSVREVLPGRRYVYPPSGDKKNPLLLDASMFAEAICKPLPLARAVYGSITGFSPLMANELAYRAGVDAGLPANALTAVQLDCLYGVFDKMMQDIRGEIYCPQIVFQGNIPIEFSSVPLTMYQDMTIEKRQTISAVLEEYYYKKSLITRIRQKSSDLRKIVSTAIERTAKKYDLQKKQLQDTESREQYRIYGELINTYGYDVRQGADSFCAWNYYTNAETEIPLEPSIPVMENAKRYFAKYNKLKRTYEALSKLTVETEEELEYLQSVSVFLDMTTDEETLAQVKEELIKSGYIKSRLHGQNTKKTAKSKPLHYISSDGFHMYVGKNNLQNDELTFQFANGGDMWFHAKKMPGSHVIVRLNGAEELPDTTYEEAARLAAYYSSGRTSPKVEIDYTERKNLKKPPAARPGFVIYHTNYSMIARPEIDGILKQP